MDEERFPPAALPSPAVVQVFDAESERRCVASRCRRLSPNQALYFPPPNQVRLTKPSNEKWEIAMHVQEAIFNRRSVREYADNAIDEPTIRRRGAQELAANWTKWKNQKAR